ncbi:putative photosynthetic complex assembly protein PuhE [Tropicimonas sp. IMCC34043]|uniref:putative photosynthetic complex assembly protein PuhE n=1 Tax=Tropicimonas sp. IMCC34043 TaxID=2248760 RepID=UPI000E25196C|nr:putative photosynthetic complex assembly protein PuhE [Tropicimonas sp. IMCC34043]
MSTWHAVAIGIFVWWSSTGVILMAVRWADRAGGRAHLLATLCGLPLLAIGWAGLLSTCDDPTARGAVMAFLSAIAVWGWFELAFLCGVLTGPNARVCPEGVPGWERFLRAWGTLAYSELALLATAVGLIFFAWGTVNPFGVWTFLVLLLARVSAKLNLYLGVPNINTEFLPVPMRHLASHFRVARCNALFPVSITLLTFATGCWMERLIDHEDASGPATGFALLAVLTALATLEHWLMVLPLPDAKLWRWLLPEAPQHPRDPAAHDVARKRRRA